MSTYRVSDHIMGTEFEEAYVLLHSETGYYFELNRVGTEIWKMILAGDSSDAIIEDIVQRYDMSRDVVAADFKELIEDLKSHGIVEETD